MSDDTKKFKISSRKQGSWRALKVRFSAAEITGAEAKIDETDTNYRIARAEWDATFGPILQNAVNSLLDKRQEQRAATASAMGYKALSLGSYGSGRNENRAFHDLASAFGVAARPEALETYRLEAPGADGQVYNSYGEKLKKFADAFNEGSVLVTRTQLEALANIAKASADYAFYALKKDDSAEADAVRSFYRENIVKNRQFSY